MLPASTLIAMAILPSLHRIGQEVRMESEIGVGSLEASIARKGNAFAQIFGEIRLGSADLMLAKTETYLHGGIAYRPHAETGEERGSARNRPGGRNRGGADAPGTLEELNDRGESSESEDRDQGQEEEIQTVIRVKDSDFRGFIGDLEREIKPWRDPKSAHLLTPSADILPWYSFMTWANRYFIRGYRGGAWLLNTEGKVEEALKFLEEGIEKNGDHPELYLLYLSKTQILVRDAMRKKRSYDAALDSAREGFEAGLRVRPEAGEIGGDANGLSWSESHEEQLLDLARYVPLLLERMERQEDALAAARESLRWMPDDAVLNRTSNRLQAGRNQ